MKIKFNGFKAPPYRDHIVVMIAGKYTKLSVGEVVDMDPKDAYALMAGGEFVEVKESAKTTAQAPSPNRAILDGKAE